MAVVILLCSPLREKHPLFTFLQNRAIVCFITYMVYLKYSLTRYVLLILRLLRSYIYYTHPPPHPPSPHVDTALKHKRTRNTLCNRYTLCPGSHGLINTKETYVFCIAKLMPKFNSCLLQYAFIYTCSETSWSLEISWLHREIHAWE